MTTPRIFLSPPHMGGAEERFVAEAFASNYIAPIGPMVDAFEREVAATTGIPHCAAVASGTAAMHLALRHLGVGPGDLILASSLTFIGSISPATFQGADLEFIDADRISWTMDPDLLADALADAQRRGRLPKAVVPTDLYGQCANLDRIRALCTPLGIPVIADAAEAMGAYYASTTPTDPPAALKPETRNIPLSPSWRHAGAGAWAAIFSFNGNKIITTSGGGMLASADEALIRHARSLATQSRTAAAWYEHEEIGYNYRMSNVLAAIGRGQLQVLEDRVTARRRIFDGYRERLGSVPGLTFMPEAPWSRANRWLTVITLDSEFGATPETVRLALERDNIEARPVWKPMHAQPCFAGVRTWGGAVSEDLFARGLCLPSGSALSDSDLDRIASILLDCHHRATNVQP